jgi:hypothetical protein
MNVVCLTKHLYVYDFRKLARQIMTMMVVECVFVCVVNVDIRA